MDYNANGVSCRESTLVYVSMDDASSSPGRHRIQHPTLPRHLEIVSHCVSIIYVLSFASQGCTHYLTTLEALKLKPKTLEASALKPRRSLYLRTVCVAIPTRSVFLPFCTKLYVDSYRVTSLFN
jgi:hypothetical protein